MQGSKHYMNILILGGTLFVGRQFVAAALAKDYSVTIFHRGKLKTPAIEGVRQVIGDRESDLHLLGDESWDVVIDTCGYVPRVLRSSIKALGNNTKSYVFISSISVYQIEGVRFLDETTKTCELIAESVDDLNQQAEGYDANKLACEQVLQELLPDKYLIVRPGLITGPFDISYRVNYWIERFKRGGTVSSFRGPDVPIQWIDVRDLCEWSLDMAAHSKTGVFNLAGPQEECSAGQFYAYCNQVAGTNIDVVYFPPEFVDTLTNEEWHLGSVLGIGGEKYDAFNRVNNSSAVKQGLTFREPSLTFKATYEWAKSYNHNYSHEALGFPEFQSFMEKRIALEEKVLNKYQTWQQADDAKTA